MGFTSIGVLCSSLSDGISLTVDGTGDDTGEGTGEDVGAGGGLDFNAGGGVMTGFNGITVGDGLTCPELTGVGVTTTAALTVNAALLASRLHGRSGDWVQ